MFFAFDTNCYFISVILFPAWLMFENSTETGLKRSRDTTAYLPTVRYFPGLYRKYKHVPVSRMYVCSKIPEFDGPGYGIKYLCATRKRDRPDRMNCVWLANWLC